jgi:hypothetical protein
MQKAPQRTIAFSGAFPSVCRREMRSKNRSEKQAKIRTPQAESG